MRAAALAALAAAPARPAAGWTAQPAAAASTTAWGAPEDATSTELARSVDAACGGSPVALRATDVAEQCAAQARVMLNAGNCTAVWAFDAATQQCSCQHPAVGEPEPCGGVLERLGYCDETVPAAAGPGTGTGAGYRGCQTRTRSGHTCQAWSRQEPQTHERTPERYPQGGLGQHNYCRNPDGETGIWCYTTAPGVRWELCDPAGHSGDATQHVEEESWDPPAVCVEQLSGAADSGYRGCQNVTQDGYKCRRWDNPPASHQGCVSNCGRRPDDYLGAGLGTHNYCRNPDGQRTIWCYTDDEEDVLGWGYCIAVGAPPATQVPHQNLSGEYTEYDWANQQLGGANETGGEAGTGQWDEYDDQFALAQEISNCSDEQLHNTDWLKSGAHYRGCQNRTRGGLTCQRWDVQEPQEHDRTPENYPTAGLGGHNYCRNPDGETTIWCYTISPDKRWDYCDVRVPGAPPEAGGGKVSGSSPPATPESSGGGAKWGVIIVVGVCLALGAAAVVSSRLQASRPDTHLRLDADDDGIDGVEDGRRQLELANRIHDALGVDDVDKAPGSDTVV